MNTSLQNPQSSSDLGGKRQLGKSDMHLTSIGFGAWAIGGGNWQYAWGTQDDNDSLNAIHRALEGGMTGSIPQRSMVWATPKKSLVRHLSKPATSPTFSPSAR